MSDHSSLVVLITGASSGIGWCTALALAKQGARLALAARRREKLEELACLIKEKHGAEALVIPTDVGRQDQAQRMIETTAAHFGRLDVLINNAGVLRMEPFEGMPVNDMRDVFETNFWSLVYSIQAVVPIMERQGGGHILNVGSGVSRRGLPFMAAYTASKFALAGLTESIRLELRPKKIRFTSVYPGGVETDMPRLVDRRKLPPNYPDHSRSRVTPERVARAIVCALWCKPLEVYVPWWVRYAAWLSVVSPSVADLLIRRHQGIE